jgi:formate dehydrogenase iron-sulfur subunit
LNPALQPFLAELLAEQQRLDTPVAQFSRAHEEATAELAALTSRLIPLSAPKAGEQYAFEVDLDSCTGCKSCVAACHSLNGLDDDETWRDVGLLVGGDRRHPFTQTITTACHHCEDPACLNGCPVLAYEKDPTTGIVRHLDDQCIGCSYCVLKCPYDVPKFSKRLGIVRKCDMCHGRLAHGEAPACAQACPTQAIRITIVPSGGQRSEDRGQMNSPPSDICPPLSASAFLPGAPDPSYTLPTTRYISKRAFPENLAAADAAALRPQPAHWPLVVLLMFMPMAVGCGIADKILTLDTPALAVVCWLSGATGLACSIAHLGQPRRAWRIFLGLRRSWLSREAVVFGAWFSLATLYTAIRLGWITGALSFASVRSVLASTTAALGVLGLFCSVMIYADTRRQFWRFVHTAPRFFGSAALLGLASALAATTLQPIHENQSILAALLAGAAIAKLLLETHALAPLNGDRDIVTPALNTARLLAGPLRPVNEWRLASAILGAIIVPVLLATHSAPGWIAWLGLAAVIGGELLERSLFFRAVDAPKMPGVPR